MNIKETIELGRKYAEGDGVTIDLERAYGIWFEVEDSLEGEDLELYLSLRKSFAENAIIVDLNTDTVLSDRDYGCFDDEELGVAQMAEGKKRRQYTAEEVTALFESLVKGADSRTLSSLYNDLNRWKRNQEPVPEEKKKGSKKLGNNIGFIMEQFDWTRSNMLGRLNKKLESYGMKPYSSSALSNVILGYNGMDDMIRARLVEVINDGDRKFRLTEKKNILRKDFTFADFDLDIMELIELFVNPIISEKTERLLKEME